MQTHVSLPTLLTTLNMWGITNISFSFLYKSPTRICETWKLPIVCKSNSKTMLVQAIDERHPCAAILGNHICRSAKPMYTDQHWMKCRLFQHLIACKKLKWSILSMQKSLYTWSPCQLTDMSFQLKEQHLISVWIRNTSQRLILKFLGWMCPPPQHEWSSRWNQNPCCFQTRTLRPALKTQTGRRDLVILSMKSRRER